MQLFSHYLHPFNFIAFKCFILLYNMFYSFSQYISCFILLPSMFYSFTSMSTCFLTCFITLMLLAQPSCSQIYIFVCFLPCLCLDPHVHVFKALFRCYALRLLQLYISCLCLSLVLWFLGALVFGQDVDLDLVV